MSVSYIIFLIIFIIIIGICAYMSTRAGFFPALNSLLRIALPMLLSGIIVKIAELMQKPQSSLLISLIIGFIGTVIFYLVFRSVLKKPAADTNQNVLNYFLGFLVGVIQGWLISGFIVLYLDYFKLIPNTVPGSLINAIVTPVHWVLFLSFIKI